ncbi:hypothetical protein C8K18_12915 [Paraburkholderia sp. GV068]|nr:hypothetical protein C8K19_1317 [Paraburkholderia sp. GV072]PUA93711.1 hypothetical protein C8K18_12915 [Paraburkholderia sp. GV068]
MCGSYACHVTGLLMCVNPGAGPFQPRKLSVFLAFKMTQNARHLN